jgi:hypothetical protein
MMRRNVKRILSKLLTVAAARYWLAVSASVNERAVELSADYGVSGKTLGDEARDAAFS